MTELSNKLKEMNFDFFASGKHQITADEFFSMKDCVFLDVRTPEEKKMLSFRLEGIREVLDMPLDRLAEDCEKIPRNRPVAIFCSGTQRASIAYGFLRGAGFDNVRILISPIEEFASYFKPGLIKRFLEK